MRGLAAVAVFAVPAVASAQPSSVPSSVPAPDLKPGDTWTYDHATERGTSSFNDNRIIMKVERVGTDTMVVGAKVEGSPVDFQEHVLGADWSLRRIIDGAQTVTGRPFSFPMSVGKTWTSRFVDPVRRGLQISAEHDSTYRVTGWEDVTTPAGTFHALKIEMDDKIKAQFAAATGAVAGALTTADGATIVSHADRSGPRTVYGERFGAIYYAPEVKYWVKETEETYNSENVRTMRQTDTLVSFKPAP